MPKYIYELNVYLVVRVVQCTTCACIGNVFVNGFFSVSLVKYILKQQFRIIMLFICMKQLRYMYPHGCVEKMTIFMNFTGFYTNLHEGSERARESEMAGLLFSGEF